jgi:hypothetical protein
MLCYFEKLIALVLRILFLSCQVSFLNITGFRDFPLGDLPMLQVLAMLFIISNFFLFLFYLYVCFLIVKSTYLFL